jgi:hypothetical protein
MNKAQAIENRKHAKNVYFMIKIECARFFTRLKWKIYRAHRRAMHRLIEHLAKKYKWHNNVLNTTVPNVPCLKVKTITVISQYGQEHTYNYIP